MDFGKLNVDKIFNCLVVLGQPYLNGQKVMLTFWSI